MNEKPYDLVAFGATSFVGKLLCRYLTHEFGFDGRLRWAAAGRSQSKLEALRTSLGDEAAALPVEIADASDEAALAAMCSKTRAVVSTVGPYAFYGEPLVRVCATTGTDYSDLTGEVPWIKRMTGLYEAKAIASGARIVVTLLAALTKFGLRRGVASLCIGGGEATAMAIEMIPG